jgi:transcriptional regulator with XRE-family HTH domain
MTTPLKRERLKRGLTGEAIAAAVGTTQATINRIEHGKQRPRAALAKRLAEYFGTTVTRDQILFPEDYMGRKRAS